MVPRLSAPRVQVNKDHQRQHLLLPLRYQQRFDTNMNSPPSKYIYPNVDPALMIGVDEDEEEETIPLSSLSHSCPSSASTAPDHAWPGDGPIDLSKVELTFAQKLWLANQHVVHKVTVRELHERYNIRVARLWYYINGVKNGTYFKEKRGRPYLLDKKSVISILESMFLNPTMSDQELKNLILNNHKEMYTRRLGTNSSSNESYKKIACGTVNRYMQDVRGWLSTYRENRIGLDGFDEKSILNSDTWNSCKVM